MYGNSCRSQMAEGILKSFDKKMQVFSAGIKPEKEISHFAVKVMLENGIDISKNYPKNIKLFKNENFDYLITLSENAKKKCRDLNVNKEINFEVKDPFEVSGTNEEIISEYRKVRDEISNLLKTLSYNY